MNFIKYEEIYKNEIVELLNICFGNKSITAKSFEWKHFDSYFNEKQVAYIAIENNKVCAFVCFTPVSIVLNNQTFEFYSCAVQATHPDYRRLGIISKITQQIESEISSTNYLGFSNNSGVKIDLNSKKINYQILGQMVTKYLVQLSSSKNLIIKEFEFIDDTFLEKYKSNKFIFQKSTEYLKWRYLNNPKNKFNYYHIYDGSDCIAVAITRKSPFVYNILDMLVLDDAYTKDCITSLSKYAIMKSFSVVSFTYLPNNYWKKMFTGISLTKLIDIYFTVKSVNNDFLDVENWLVQGGDIQ